jgi:hypothetical protein
MYSTYIIAFTIKIFWAGNVQYAEERVVQNIQLEASLSSSRF